MRKLSKILSVLLVGALLISNTMTNIAFAEESASETNSAEAQNNVITSMTVTELDEPKDGVLMDMSATVVANNGASWKIPVIWVDEDGNICTVYSANTVCYPVFVFYVPEGYVIDSTVDTSSFLILPQFVQAIYGDEPLITIMDSSQRISYITIANGPAKNVQGSEVSIFANEIRRMEEDLQGDDIEPSDESPYYAPEHLVEMYCDQNAVDELGWERLAALVSLVKYVVQPQAVTLLVNEFSCFYNAVYYPDVPEGTEGAELGSGIGLYVYYDYALIPDGAVSEGKYKYDDYSDAVAYVSAHPEDNGQIYYTVGVNAGVIKDYMVYNEESGDWELNDEGMATLENTLIHEMFHAFMEDYTTTGMTGYIYNEATGEYEYHEELDYPRWFVEGMATTVDNPYQYWYADFVADYGYVEGEYINYYDQDSLVSNYTTNEKLQLVYGEDYDVSDNNESSYVSGYLACMYLGYIASTNPDYREIYGITGDAWVRDDDGTYSFNNEVIKEGLNAILSELHGIYGSDGVWYSKTLDQVVDDLFGVDPDELDYTTADYQADFIAVIEDSADFSASLLSYYEYYSTEGAIVNGSVLLPADSTAPSSINDYSDIDNPVYVIQEKEDIEDPNPLYVPSDAQNLYADGGKSEVPDEEDYDDENIDDDENTDDANDSNQKISTDGTAVAAKPEAVDIVEDEAEPADEENDEGEENQTGNQE